MREPRLSESTTVPATPFAVFCGLDVGKSEHHACALDVAGRRLHDKALPNDEAALRALFERLGQQGRVLVVVDQPASIGALAVAVARELGVEVAYLPGLAMRRIADLHPASPRPTPATRMSSPTRHGRCRTRCGASVATRRPSPS